MSLLGLIDPDAFAGGTISLDLGAAEDGAGARHWRTASGLTTRHGGLCRHEMVCENMASAARVHAAERGEVIRTTP